MVIHVIMVGTGIANLQEKISQEESGYYHADNAGYPNPHDHTGNDLLSCLENVNHAVDEKMVDGCRGITLPRARG